MPSISHNHVTRDIKSLGECPSCDHTHVSSSLRARLIELQACSLDDDDDFKRVVAAATETTLQLIELDRRSRT